MKVVHVVEALEGGVYTYFKDLSTFFGDKEISNAVETTILYSGHRNGVSPEKVNAEFSTGVRLIHLSMVREISPLKDLKSTIKLIQELKKINPDIVHLHSSKAGVLGRIACFFLFKKKKLFYTPHGYAFLRTDISKNSRRLYSIIENRFQQIFGGTIIACGDTEFEIAKKIGPSKLVRNGVDISEIRQYFLPHHNSKLTVGILGRITAARNPKLFNDIALRFPEFDFVWIGNGELNALITAPNIKITGWILDKKKVFEELNAIDIYLQTSLWEGLPIAVLEAMVLEKPVVATNIIGNKDLVLQNQTGYLFDKIEELNSYFEILKDHQTRISLGQNAFRRTQELFDKNKSFNQLLDLYKE
ncbi:glycosyltransferase [Flavobacterium reichenbachii]|uniref:Glycosyl transferase family 1 n=1 Tax=Flavobacterium reichenbachii TaxID=362418 RepID=A0A085ZSK1_9FLAO|nr:glycosyltransferase [Flavobacterium reichenbachii]KFF07415.1 glycosyl transferase family 1 [Flavobacterium reichenbachii]OXB13104.1 glycosyl transferase family 1 [Flavobacterium reichenbachii]